MKWFDRGMALVCFYALALPVTATVIINRAHWGVFLTWLSGEAGAGWFQALGSVASILFSGWLVTRQISANRDLEIERRRADFYSRRNLALHTIDYSANAVATLCTGMANNFQGNKAAINALSVQISVHKDAIHRIDPGLLPQGITEELYGCSLQFNLIATWCDEMVNQTDQIPNFIATLKDSAARLQKCRDAIHTYFDAQES